MPIVMTRKGAQQRAVRKDGWTIAKRATFLDELALTCNVTRAAEKAGMSHTSARQLRKRDGEFAILWAQAIASGTDRLEELLMSHMLGQVPTGDNPSGERPAAEVHPFDPRLALEVLKMRTGSGPGKRPRAGQRPSQGEVDAALLSQLDALAKRLPKE